MYSPSFGCLLSEENMSDSFNGDLFLLPLANRRDAFTPLTIDSATPVNFAKFQPIEWLSAAS